MISFENILSLFDGMSCLQIALQRSGISYKKYYASEIDKHAIKATQHNFPDTIQIGDVTKVSGHDLPIINFIGAGSPCQGFSFAGKMLNFNDPRSKLFFEFVRILKECGEKNPELLFILENVKMEKEHELVISKALGVNPILINSTLVSAQNRERLYWTNIGLSRTGLFGHLESIIQQPKDRKIIVNDILEDEVDEKYYLSEKALNRLLLSSDLKKGFSKINPEKSIPLLSRQYANYKGNFIAVNDVNGLREIGDKSLNIDANYFKGHDNHGARTMVVAIRGRNPDNPKSRVSGLETEQMIEPRFDQKIGTLSTVQKDNMIIQLNNSKESGGKQPFQQNRVYDPNHKSPAITADINGIHKIVVQRGRGKNKGGEHHEKSPTLSSNSFEHNNHIVVHHGLPRTGGKKQGGTGPLKRTDGKTYCLDSAPNTNNVEYDMRIRRFTPKECLRLQTCPDNYFEGSGVSETQQYKMCGNGWTIDVICWILRYLKQNP